MPTWLLGVIEYLHILSAVFWFGSVLFADVVIAPVVRAIPLDVVMPVLGPLGDRVRPMVRAAGGLTVILGLLLGIGNGVLSILGSAYGITWVIAFALGIGLVLWGILVSEPATRRPTEIEMGPTYETAVRSALRILAIELLGFLAILGPMVAMKFGY